MDSHIRLSARSVEAFSASLLLHRLKFGTVTANILDRPTRPSQISEAQLPPSSSLSIAIPSLVSNTKKRVPALQRTWEIPNSLSTRQRHQETIILFTETADAARMLHKMGTYVAQVFAVDETTG